MNRLMILWALMTAVGASGCAEVQELSISARNRSAAYSAWKGARWDYFRQGVPYRVREHIGRGFQEGYYEVAQGGSGKLPLFPPNYYWGVQFQNAAGNELVAAWFRGYQDGAMAAERDGIGGFNQLPSSYSGVGPMPGVAPSYDPNQPAGPYGEPLPPPSTVPLTPVPPTIFPEPNVPPPLQEVVPLRTLDAPEFPAPPKPAAPPTVPGPLGPGNTVPGLNSPSTIPTPNTTPAPTTPPAVPRATPSPSPVPSPTSPAAPRPSGSATPTSPAPRVGTDEPFGPVPTGVELDVPPAVERPSTARIRVAAPRGDSPEATFIPDLPAQDSPYAQQTLFAEPNP